MDPTLVANLRAALSAIGVIQPNASDQTVMSAWATYQQQNPAAAQALAQQVSPPSMSPLMILGLAGGAVALYLIWRHYQKPKQIDAYDYPESEDPKHNLRRMTKTMSHLRVGGLGRSSSSSSSRMASCRPRGMGRFGDKSDKYEFEPERRLEGYKRKAQR
jgi:hypothetical protein